MKMMIGNGAFTGGAAIGLGLWSMVNGEDIEAQLCHHLDGDGRRRWWPVMLERDGGGVKQRHLRAVRRGERGGSKNGEGIHLQRPRAGLRPLAHMGVAVTSNDRRQQAHCRERHHRLVTGSMTVVRDRVPVCPVKREMGRRPVGRPDFDIFPIFKIASKFEIQNEYLPEFQKYPNMA
jgi:hypothetical protein